MKERDQGKLVESETRNSPFRHEIAGMVQTVVNRLHAALPDLTPTHLNALGAIGTGIGAVLATERDGNDSSRDKALTVASLALLSASTSLDAFDGTLARTMAKEAPERINFQRGQLYDVVSDRTQELLMALSRAVSAHKRGDKLGTAAALLNASTNTLPSTARAFAESKKHIVPETGHGLFEFIGTRPGRATLGIAATVFPEVGNVPVQVITDALTASANILTTVDRLHSIRKTSPELSEKIQHDARTRLMTLSLFSALSLGISAFMYHELQKQNKISVPKRQEKPEKPMTESERCLSIISRIEQYCTDQHLDHRFVGGIVTDLIGPETQFDISIRTRTVRLRNQNESTIIRKDCTIKDIDLLVFPRDALTFDEARRTFREWRREAASQNLPFPNISVESARYPNDPPRKRWKQMVTVFEIDGKGDLHMTYGDISKQIPWMTVEPWKLDVGNGISFTILHPYAHTLCYILRMPSGVKRKDREIYQDGANGRYNKMSLLMRLAKETIRQGVSVRLSYREKYASWVAYILMLQRSRDLPVVIKRTITRLYWDTIGTDMSHGKGIFREISTLSDRFCG